jgi:hypothetical protein
LFTVGSLLIINLSSQEIDKVTTTVIVPISIANHSADGHFPSSPKTRLPRQPNIVVLMISDVGLSLHFSIWNKSPAKKQGFIESLKR